MVYILMCYVLLHNFDACVTHTLVMWRSCDLTCWSCDACVTHTLVMWHSCDLTYWSCDACVTHTVMWHSCDLTCWSCDACVRMTPLAPWCVYNVCLCELCKSHTLAIIISSQVGYSSNTIRLQYNAVHVRSSIQQLHTNSSSAYRLLQCSNATASVNVAWMHYLSCL